MTVPPNQPPSPKGEHREPADSRDPPAVTRLGLHGSVLTRRLASARRDPLTGLHTRAGWTARAEHCIRRHPRAAVLLVDLDHFKTLNDTHGHAAGDAALIATAHRLPQLCGTAGNRSRELGGGSKFVGASALDAVDLRPSTQRALRQPTNYEGAILPLAASVGVCPVAELPVPALTDALAAADAAMYAARRAAARRAPAHLLALTATGGHKPPRRPTDGRTRAPGWPPPGAVPSNRNRKEPPLSGRPPHPSRAEAAGLRRLATVARTDCARRDSHGHLRTLTIDCPACHGTGTVPARRVRERVP
ncbi:GGDEF domain-containing protein [Streptomyces sp. DHE17-7]|uniref:GGDEF domain-containing protein n=1 Tax=Streptomyces sp. DHE17-7 TaxID=2759949 RepID=UPI002FCE2B4C